MEPAPPTSRQDTSARLGQQGKPLQEETMAARTIGPRQTLTRPHLSVDEPATRSFMLLLQSLLDANKRRSVSMKVFKEAMAYV